jgi:hypothetical protein
MVNVPLGYEFATHIPFLLYLYIMKVIISEEQLRKIVLNEQQVQSTNLTSVEQTMLGFLSRFLRGEDKEMETTPTNDLKKIFKFNDERVYPMAQRLLEKKNTGKKTYNDNEFKAMFMTMDKNITKEQRFEFYQEGGKITKIQYHAQY